MWLSSVLIMGFGGGIRFIEELCTRTDSFTIEKYQFGFFMTRYFTSVEGGKYLLHLVFRKQCDAK